MPDKDLLPEWQGIVSAVVVDREYNTDKTNMDSEIEDLESAMNMLVCDRDEKDYEWQSDIYIPDYASMHHTQIGELVAQYFTSSEKVDCIPGTDPLDILKSKAGKEFLNYHLNARYMHHLQKFIRMNSFTRLAGYAVLKIYYESDVEIRQELAGTRPVLRATGVDIYGDPIESPDHPYPERMVPDEEPIYDDIKEIHRDRPNYEVWPNQDFFTDNKYAYSLQEKDHCIFRSEVKLSDLQEQAEICQYFNLEILDQDTETDTENATYNRQNKGGKKYDRIIHDWNPDVEILERWGKWPVVFEDSPDGPPIPINALQLDGTVLEGATLIEMIITVANIKNRKVLIRFQPNLPEYGGFGFRPMTRLLCYIHPTKDRGIGDGKYAKELQKAINDNFNMTNDRNHMATFPTFTKKRSSLLDNSDIMLAPEHVIEVEEQGDVELFPVTDAPEGIYQQNAMLFGKLQQILATYATDMGGFPARREPVTTTLMASEKSNTRNSLVNLTIEHTGLAEFYDMLLRVSGMFMQPETLQEVLGELTPFFDPEMEYNFTPVSTAILSESAKETKIKIWDQILGRIVGLPHPGVWNIINMILGEIMELYGKEYGQYGKMLLDPRWLSPDMLLPEGGGGGEQQKESKDKKQNQHGNKQSSKEQKVRQIGTAAGGG